MMLSGLEPKRWKTPRGVRSKLIVYVSAVDVSHIFIEPFVYANALIFNFNSLCGGLIPAMKIVKRLFSVMTNLLISMI